MRYIHLNQTDSDARLLEALRKLEAEQSASLGGTKLTQRNIEALAGYWRVLMALRICGAPGEARTPGLMIRSHSLYPTELRAHVDCPFIIRMRNLDQHLPLAPILNPLS